MKLTTFQHAGDIKIGGVIDGERIIPLTEVAPDMNSLIAQGSAGLEHAQSIIDKSNESIPLEEVRLLAPIPRPIRNIMCLGKNYAAHALEAHRAWGDAAELPEFPLIFTKSVMAVTGPFDEIPYNPDISTAIDYESELVVVIGQPGINISRAAAMEHVYGYTIMNDLTARDLQRRHKQFFKGKSLDGHAPMGPWIVTADEIPDPHNLNVSSAVNGAEKQNDNTKQMMFDIPEIIAQLSLGMALWPGDLISTGTPEGVGFARTPPEFLKPGDVITCTVEGIGSIRNRISSSR
ncbi:MAG: fumarylacetoacetate hydrolase family protein [Candidatus Promineifilaceae bacterium]|nr:fumarylacetoacetate hydrolase family protein [Candidatus Promineifilaceae bacterium]